MRVVLVGELVLGGNGFTAAISITTHETIKPIADAKRQKRKPIWAGAGAGRWGAFCVLCPQPAYRYTEHKTCLFVVRSMYANVDEHVFWPEQQRH